MFFSNGLNPFNPFNLRLTSSVPITLAVNERQQAGAIPGAGGHSWR